MENLRIKEHVLSLIENVTSNLPKDVEEKLREIKEIEEPGSASYFAVESILKNIEASRKKKPMCQDTGTLVFEIFYPFGISTLKIKKEIEEAIVEATSRILLRPNSVDSITGKNSGNNLGIGQPYLHFNEWEKDEIMIKLLLKGGGSENVSCQYSLPNAALKAGRDLDGVRKVVLDGVVKAQGKGCGPGIIGIGIGGDRGSGYLLAKKQLFRNLNDINPDPVLKELEERLHKEINSLGIGPMGFGGNGTAMAVKAGAMHRIPASFYVSIAYLCWAARKGTLVIDNQGNAKIE